jgi:1-aminocyclopropane-1-carboxylate deaminase/D-cysteine desulfhydrase-like pyridoxal-dependent ACC family enzyme
VPDGDWDALDAAAVEIAESLRREGKRVYQVAGGGSSPVGALGFVSAANEILSQDGHFDVIVFASGSGGTHAGLAYGFALLNSSTRIIGVSTDNEPELKDVIAEVANGIDDLLGARLAFAPQDFDLRLDFHGGGYQAPSEQARNAAHFLARAEGIFLDPIYTSKAFAGLLALVKSKEIGGRVLFWHTGGFPCAFLSAYEP